MTPREAALRVTVLEALKAGVEAEYEAARKDAEQAFHAMAAETGVRAAKGALQVPAELPDGQVLGTLSIKAGVKTTKTDDVGLHEWAAERNPEALEEYVLADAVGDVRVFNLLQEECPDLFDMHLRPGAFQDPRVLPLLRDKMPDLVSSRVRPGALASYVKEAVKVTEDAPKGWLFDPESGEKLHLVKETQEKSSGAFSFVGAESPERRRLVMAALANGDPAVRAIAFGGMLTLPSTEQRGDAA